MNDQEDRIYRDNCQKLLKMIGILYERGYTAINVKPCIREGTGRWQLFIHSSLHGQRQTLQVHKWFSELAEPEIDYSTFEKTPCTLSLEELADKFIEDHSKWLLESKKHEVNEMFITWFQAFLKILKEGQMVDTLINSNDSSWFVRDLYFRTVLIAVPCSVTSLKLPLMQSFPLYIKTSKALIKNLFRF